MIEEATYNLLRGYMEAKGMVSNLEYIQQFVWEYRLKLDGPLGSLLLTDAFGLGVSEGTQFADWLLKWGADVNVPFYGDGTPLHWLLSEMPVPGEEVSYWMHYLVRNGADMNLRSKLWGESPLEYILGNFIDDYDEIFSLAYEALSLGADVNARDVSGFTAFHSVNSPAAVSFLVRNGADVNEKTDNGETPRHIKCKAGYLNTSLDLLEALIVNGADVNAKNNRGETALRLCPDDTLAGFLLNQPAISLRCITLKGKAMIAKSNFANEDIFMKLGTSAPCLKALAEYECRSISKVVQSGKNQVPKGKVLKL